MIKKVLYFAFVAFLSCACSGYVDPEVQDNGNGNNNGDENTEIPEEYTAPFTLSVDKETIEASGSDWVYFSLKDAYDREMITDNKALSNINIYDSDGVYLERRSVRARAIADGERTFTATYKGTKSNEVTVTAQNRKNYEKYHKNVAIYKATATWCGPCAVMTEALLGMSEETKNHSVELCWHAEDEYAFRMGGTYDCGSTIASRFGVGYPTVVLDLCYTIPPVAGSSKLLNEAVWDVRADYPASCGIKLSTTAEAGNLAIDAEMTTSTGGEYDLGMAILLHNQISPNGTNAGGKYSHIVVAATGNYYWYSPDMSAVEKDGTKTMSQNVDISRYDIKNLTVVAFALIKYVDDNGNVSVRIDNAVEVAAGQNLDYQLN